MAKKSKFKDKEGNPLVKGRLYSHPITGAYVVKNITDKRVTLQNYSYTSFHEPSDPITTSDASQVKYLTPVDKETIQEVVQGLKVTLKGLEATVEHAPEE